uniref:N-alpha-acetyltransferase 15, NatA auxiliary subunit n=1 Tax=Timema poppense TaxID=170557 RepID=A0A7R9GY88_TIMPO|nr:unnamed protein product [Timema poppensis]
MITTSASGQQDMITTNQGAERLLCGQTRELNVCCVVRPRSWTFVVWSDQGAGRLLCGQTRELNVCCVVRPGSWTFVVWSDQGAEQNLAPADLKKLRNKQRKARRKAELEKQQAAQAQEKREQHNKSRQQGDAEPDAPQQDELVPEKLARIEDPLEHAIKFLQPLQTLAAHRIETHLMAFQIYYRKQKPLLMLQSIKRAHRLDPSHSELHPCLVIFLQSLSRWKGTLDHPVAMVISQEMEPITKDRSAHQLNKQFLGNLSHLLDARFEAARMMHHLDSSTQQEAITLATSLNKDIGNITLKTCVKVLQALRNGEFGHCPAAVQDYQVRCHARFPYAQAFRPTSPLCDNNHITDSN